jgi:hypothetical protein
VLALTLLPLVQGCGPSPLVIVNDSNDAVTVVECAQAPGLNWHLTRGQSHVLDDRVYLSDDPGFACLITRGRAKLCLSIPTDQSAQSSFPVSRAVVTVGPKACFARSSPHI